MTRTQGFAAAREFFDNAGRASKSVDFEELSFEMEERVWLDGKIATSDPALPSEWAEEWGSAKEKNTEEVFDVIVAFARRERDWSDVEVTKSLLQSFEQDRNRRSGPHWRLWLNLAAKSLG